ASPEWMVQGGAQVSNQFNPIFDWDEDERATYRSVYAAAGPWTSSPWFMAGAVAGPAVTWGTHGDRPGTCGGGTCDGGGHYGEEPYLSLGLVGGVQGFVRLDGRVWLGGETMVVASPSNSHLASRIAVRVDLLRPGR
ncbi:MAG: hypothetical protein R3362_06300, partial [Rhodothermales bacterium]|nr:hypothetical protein [Rhodothermales bacterium]